MLPLTVRLNPRDNVVVARVDLLPGSEADGGRCIADGRASVAEMGHRILDLVLATASGRRTKSEEPGFGEDEFTPWVLGAVM